MDTMIIECIAQRGFRYRHSALNKNQIAFVPGDTVRVLQSDYPRLSKNGLVKAENIEPKKFTFDMGEKEDIFPKRSPDLWVVGDGPTSLMMKGKWSKESVIFAVNRCFYEKKKDGSPALGLVPDYYVALDDFTMKSEQESIKKLASVRKYTKRGNGEYNWPDVRLFDVPEETGFSTEPLIVYHGKTSIYCALQLAVQCGLSYYSASDLKVNLAGIDLAVLQKADGTTESHHYGKTSFDTCIFTRMLKNIRYGLDYLNKIGVKWENHSPLLEGRIKDLKK